MKHLSLAIFFFFNAVFSNGYLTSTPNQSQKSTIQPINDAGDECDIPGWFPEDFGLKDHSVFTHDGYYYIVSNYLPVEKYFAYSRSKDFCNWEVFSPILTDRSGEWDNQAIWAPHVIEEDGTYYMYYTGVKGPYPHLTQSIMLATSTDPSDPDSWTEQGMIFQPDHPEMKWEDNTWANCRDPMVLKVNRTYFMYYTGEDIDGGIVGMATAFSPQGPWIDWGSTLAFEGDQSYRIPESTTVFSYDDFYYIFYNSNKEYYRISPTPGGPWSDEYSFLPGWAHELWAGLDNQTYTSYLTDYSVTISRVSWDSMNNIPRPFIGDQIFHLLAPLIIKD